MTCCTPTQRQCRHHVDDVVWGVAIGEAYLTVNGSSEVSGAESRMRIRQRTYIILRLLV